ncbi:hypothetical protein ACLKA6_018618 [Drosophila palustris]
MGMRCVYLILLVLLPMVTAGRAVKQPQHQQYLEKWQLEQLELQSAHSEGNRADNDHGPWIHISSAVLELVPDKQTHLLLLQTHEAGSSTTMPLHHIHGQVVTHKPRIGLSDNLDFQQPPMSIKSHGR